MNVIKAARAIQPQSTLADATDRFLGGPAAEVLDELDLQIKSLQILQELDLECNVEAELADAQGVQDALRTHGSVYTWPLHRRAKLRRARSRPDRRRCLQVNSRWKALCEIH